MVSDSDDNLKSLDTFQYTTSLYIDYSRALIAPSHFLTFSPRRQQGQQSKMSITTQPTLRGATAICPGACIHGTKSNSSITSVLTSTGVLAM
jgi:hypothetical protein